MHESGAEKLNSKLTKGISFALIKILELLI